MIVYYNMKITFLKKQYILQITEDVISMDFLPMYLFIKK